MMTCRKIAPVLVLVTSWAFARAEAQEVSPNSQVFLAQNVQHGPNDKASDAQPVTLTFKNASCADALTKVAREAKVTITFTDEQVRDCPRVTLKLVRMSAEEAFAQIVRHTAVMPVASAPGRFVLVQRANAPKDSIAAGTVKGHVVDSTGRPVSTANVTIDGAKPAVLTTESGDFVIPHVPVGDHRVQVRVFGYHPTAVPVTVTDAQTATVRIVLTPMATALAGVVTTATGIQRRIEVGNDITSINVDSVLRVMPVMSFTDLLATRVPGLDVQRTSGAPGAPSRVRIRGVSSMLATNDPILILDGVRLNANQQRRQDSLFMGFQFIKQTEVPSPLDQIDPNSIETVEVLKGPSAVALYGTDAANGVIVVTTKRGQSSATRWELGASLGRQTTPGKYPDNLFRWGTTSDGQIVHCLLGNVTDQSGSQACTPDSVTAYQYLNDKRMTVLGNGRISTLQTSVTGGTRGLTYAVSGSLLENLGMLKMPDADVDVLRRQRDSLPDWMIHPQENNEQNLTVNLQADVNPQSQISVTSGFVRQSMRTTPLSNGLGTLLVANPVGATNAAADSGTGLLKQIPNFREHTTSRTLRSFTAATYTANPWAGIHTQVTGGLDLTDTRDLNALFNGACPTDCPEGPGGHYGLSTGSVLVSSLNANVSRLLSAGSALSLRTTVGGNFTRTNSAYMLANSFGLAPGAISGAGSDFTLSAESRDDRSTAGVYVETVIGIANRFYLPLALRKDAGSALGKNVAPLFPKISTSWLISDQPFFPKSWLVNTLRLRVAYGQSGVQPGPDVKLRTYSQSTGWVDGDYRRQVSINGLGNLNLRPERSREIEGGFDVATANDRVSLGLTFYNKRTIDALVSHSLPLSVNGGATVQENIGNVSNHGLELTLEATPLDLRNAVWHVSTGISSTRNKLLTLGQSAAIGGDSSRFVVGYPLFGRWARPVTAYGDLNGDGFVTADEVQYGDSSVYLGAPYPDYEMSLHSTVTLFGRFTVGTTFNYQNGLNQYNGTLGGFTSRAWNDPHTSLGEQAYVGPGAVNGISQIGFAQTVSTLRFDALSLNYMLPTSVTRRLFGKIQTTVALQGENLHLWSNYRGKDPNVSAVLGDGAYDSGILPEPRTWQLSFRLN